MIKVLHIGTEKSWRGGENQIKLLLEQMDSQKFESHLAYPAGSECEKRMKNIVPFLSMPSTGALSLRNILKINRYIKEQGIQILHAHSGNAHTLCYYVSKINKKIQIVVHRRVDMPISNKRQTKKKYLSDRVFRFVAISTKIENELVKWGISRDKIVVAKVQFDRFRPLLSKENVEAKTNKRAWSFASTYLIGNASALTSEKGHETLIRAMSKIPDNDTICLLAGTGNEKETYEKLAEELGVSKKLKFLGFVENVREYLQGLDVLIVPSTSEGLGTILLEGAFADCVLIGSNVGGIPEIIQDGATGFLIEPGDSDRIVKLLSILQSDGNLVLDLKKRSREHVTKYFSVEKMALVVESVYREIENQT